MTLSEVVRRVAFTDKKFVNGSGRTFQIRYEFNILSTTKRYKIFDSKGKEYYPTVPDLLSTEWDLVLSDAEIVELKHRVEKLELASSNKKGKR